MKRIVAMLVCMLFLLVPFNPSGGTYATGESKNGRNILVDTNPPKIRLIEPLPASIYIGDHCIPVPLQLCPQLWNKTLILFSLRGITIKVAAIDYETGIDRVEFYVDNEMEPRDVEIKEYPEQYVFAWCWGETMFREEHVVKVVAYDKANNSATLDINIEVFLTIHLPPIW